MPVAFCIVSLAEQGVWVCPFPVRTGLPLVVLQAPRPSSSLERAAPKGAAVPPLPMGNVGGSLEM